MARLLYVRQTQLAELEHTFEPPPAADPSWKARRPQGAAALDPWFELTPSLPSIDTRVAETNGPAVTASLETFGGITGPTPQYAPADRGEVVLGGNAVAPGAPAPADLGTFRRQCTARLSIVAEDLGANRQCLAMLALVGYGVDGPPFVQTFLGSHLLREDAILGEERLPILVDAHPGGRLRLDIWLRLAAISEAISLGVRGVQAFLL